MTVKTVRTVEAQAGAMKSSKICSEQMLLHHRDSMFLLLSTVPAHKCNEGSLFFNARLFWRDVIGVV